jgi:hypothetical protein
MAKGDKKIVLHPSLPACSSFSISVTNGKMKSEARNSKSETMFEFSKRIFKTNI